MGKRGKKAKRRAEGAAGAAALGAFLSQPIVKDLVVKGILAVAAAAAQSERVRALANRVRERRR